MQYIYAYIKWNADPDFIHLGSITIRWYGLLYAFAFYLGYRQMQKIYKKEKRSVKEIERLAVYMILGILVGGKLARVFVFDRIYYEQHPWDSIKFWAGGISTQGAALGILLAMYIYYKKAHLKSYLWLMDRVSISVCLGSAVIRIGNLMNSAMYGKETTLPWGFKFLKDPVFAGMDIDAVPAFHPTQLYESFLYFIIFLILNKLYKRHHKSMKQGTIFGLFLILIFTIRFCIGFLKSSDSSIEKFIASHMLFSLDQLFSLIFITAGFLILFMAKKNLKSPAKNSLKSV